MQSTMIPRYSGIIDASEYPEPDHIPAAVYSDLDDDAEDTEESSPVLVSSKLLSYTNAHVRKPSGAGRPKAITSLDELFKPSYGMPMGSPHPVPTHDAIFDRSAKSHEQVDSNLPLLDKIYGKPPTHLPTSYLPSSSSSSSASVPSVQQQQLHERVNARFGTATTSLGSTLARRIYGQRNSFYSAASQDNSHIMPRPPSSIPLSRTPSLTVSSSGSCESLASSAASHASSTPAVMSRSNSQNRVRRSSIVSNDASLLPPNTKVTRKPSITRIPTASSLPVTTNNDTIALHNASSDSLPNRRYSTLETTSQWRSSIQPPIRSHRSCDSISSVDSTLNESDNAQKLLVSIRTRHDRLISMLDNIRNRMAQVRQSWEEDENDRQQYIARLRHSVLLEHDLPSVEPSSPTTYRKSRRSSLPAPTLPAKSTRRQAPMSSGTGHTAVPSTTKNGHHQRVSSTASSTLAPIVEMPSTLSSRTFASKMMTTSSQSTAAATIAAVAATQPSIASKRNIEHRRSGLPTLSSRPRSRLL